MPPRELKEISDNIQLNQNDTISLLYVDDEQDLLIVGKIFLERTGGFTVETMTSAKEALNSPFIQSYDAIVSDYQMPGMNGIEFLKVIREKHGDIPFILFTGRGREEIVIEAINNGADFYLQKGGEPKSQFAELSHKIKQAVRSRRAEKERQEQFNELVRIKEALEESESKFRAIVETTPDAIWEIDLSGTFVYISPRCKEIIGYTQDEMTGSSSFEYLNDEGSLILKTLLNNVHTRKPGIGTFDIPAIHKDKSIRILNFRTYPLVNADNNLIGFRGICSDVTERTAFVNALHESEIRLRSFFEATSEGIFIIDEDGIIIEWNAMSEKIFGIEKEKALGAYLWDLQFLVMRPEIQQTTSVDAVRQNILSSLKTGMPVYQEPVTIEAVRPDGRGIITRQTIFPIQTDKGYRFGSVLEDITEEMHMAEALRESEERFRGMAERSPDLIIIVDKEMDISYVSPSATAIIGYEPGELIGNPIESAFAPIFSNNSQDIAEIIWKIKGGESIESKEIQIQKKDGSKVFVNFYAIPTSFEGILSGIQISMRDITQNKIYEVERRNSEEKFVTLFNKNPVTLTLVSIVDGCFIDLNEAFERNTGFHRDEVVGRSSKELGLFADEAEYQQFSQELKEKHFVLGMELQCRAKSGEIRLCRFSSSIIIIQGVPQILSSIEDITEYKQNEAMLREREERYRLIMQNAYEGILVNELTPRGPGFFIDANESACRILGMSLEELRKVKLIDLDTPEMKSRAPAIMQTIQKNGHASFQTNYISKENQVKTIEISVSLFNLNGKTTMLSNIRDITEQKEAESAMNAMVTSIVGTTGTGSLDRIVASVCEWLDADCVMIGGFSPDKEHIRAYSMVFDGKKINDFSFPLKGTPCESTPKEGFSFYPDNVSDNFPDIKNLTGKDFRGYIGAPLKNSEGDVNGVICILSYKPINPTISIQEIIAIIAEKAGADIERAHIEQVLIKNERTLAETMNMANLVSWEYDFETQLFTFDDRFYALYATTAEREGGYMMSAEKYTLEFVYPADIPKVLEEAAKSNEAVDPDFISEFEHRIIRRDGEMRYFSVRVRAVFDEDGKLIKTHGANQDITGQKYIEEALLRANNQLNLLSGITRHDILNNISIFHGYLKLLEIDCDNPEMHGYIRKMTESINKIQYQIEFSRVYQDLGSQKPLWISLDSVLLRTSLPETVHFSGNVSGISVFADPILEKVFYNLLDNSTRHGNNVTEISVFTQEENRSLIIVYEDNGVGIPQEEKEIIFERGYGKNTGHGLFLVREILQLTNISIRETGTFGKGARFEITVPSGLYRKSG